VGKQLAHRAQHFEVRVSARRRDPADSAHAG
jgi:hypothetical protein